MKHVKDKSIPNLLNVIFVLVLIQFSTITSFFLLDRNNIYLMILIFFRSRDNFLDEVESATLKPR